MRPIVRQQCIGYQRDRATGELICVIETVYGPPGALSWIGTTPIRLRIDVPPEDVYGSR